MTAACLAQSIMGFTATEWWTMAVAVCCSVACGVIGCFLVLRRLSLLGDAISHAILPGIAVAFMVTDSRAPLPMLAGALAVGLLTAVLSSGLHRWGRVPEDAAMGVVFATLFAIGVMLIAMVAHEVDLDPGCVLYGNLELAGADLAPIGGVEVPRALLTLGPVLLLNVAVVAVFFKELKIVSFDPALAATMGISVALVHYTLMTLVAATCVASFEAVGSVLVIAMLVAPGATAHLLTDRLSRMLWIAAAVAASAGVIGYILAAQLSTYVAGMVGAVAGGEFFLAALFAPRHGFVSKVVHRVALALRIDREDVLGMLYRWHERARETPKARPLAAADVVAGVAGGWVTRTAVWSLRRSGAVASSDESGLTLTEAGITEARGIIRSHRLWETYLAKHLGLPPDHLHQPSHRAEHFISPEMQEALDREADRARDPHGREIPPATR
ncbi:MAG: metal ABC transporter permease [Phycisphaerales bacterium]